MLIVDEHERSLQKAKEEHLKQLEEVKKAKETSGFVLLLSFLIFSSKGQIVVSWAGLLNDRELN